MKPGHPSSQGGRSSIRIVALIILSFAASLVFDPVGPALAGGGKGPTGTSLTGSLHTIWGDGPPGSAQQPGGGHLHLHLLVDDTGQATQLSVPDRVIAAAGGRKAINGRRVTVSGQLGRTTRGVGTPAPLAVQTMTLAQQKGTSASDSLAQAVTGAQKWVSILCRFADSANVTPYPKSWFETLMLGSSAAPGLDHYWRQTSFGNINLTGSVVVGWYTLPQPRSYYVYGNPAQLDHQRAANDCTGVADADVYFPDFVGVNLMFNDVLDCCAWGGSTGLNRDGQFRVYRVTWLPPWGYENQGPIAHEMGHGFGLPHSSGPYSATYDSRWDVMSDIWGNCPPYDSTYGCVGQHTIAYHKDTLGWIPSNRKYVGTPGTSQTVAIEPLDQLAQSGYMMAQIPLPGSSTQFYTVETRRKVGYDAPLPGHAVIIHKVDVTRSDRDAQVVDPDADGDPDDASAMWLAGEGFVDSTNAISISVVGTTTEGFLVTVTNDSSSGPTSYLLSVTVSGPGTVTSSPPGITCSTGTCSANFQSGATVMLTPTAGSLASWGGACSGSGSCTVSMTANRSATATFTAIAPDITATPTSVAFGPVVVGSLAKRDITLRNDGNANLVLGTLTVTGADASHFVLPVAKDLCSGQTLTPGLSCTVRVKFRPVSTGTKTAALRVPSNDPDENPLSIALTGSGSSGGASLPDITVAPAAVAFGTIPKWFPSLRTVTITNDGTANLVLGSATLSANTGETTRPAAQDLCSGKTLAPGQSCTLRVMIIAVTSGSKTGTLTIPSNDPDESPVTVSVTATVN